MDNYFTSQLKEFLSETACDITIKNIQIWKKNNFIKLDITIKNKKTITNLGDCEKIHKLIMKWTKQQEIDEKTKISVLAEGIDKILFDLEDYNESINEKVKIELKEKIDDRKNYTGFLIAVKNDKVVLNIENKKYELAFENIKKAQIIPNI